MRLVILVVLGLFALASGQDIGCYVPGNCPEGTVKGISPTASAAECIEYCESVDDCKYFTYFIRDSVCFALEDCPAVSAEDCPDCISGDSTCSTNLCNNVGKSQALISQSCNWKLFSLKK